MKYTPTKIKKPDAKSIGFLKNFVSFTVYATTLSGALNKFITFTFIVFSSIIYS
jgi:hypothetical protein